MPLAVAVKVLIPTVPLRTSSSLPEPPSILSLPPPAFHSIRSFPLPPSMLSLAVPPRRVSLPSLPASTTRLEVALASTLSSPPLPTKETVLLRISVPERSPITTSVSSSPASITSSSTPVIFTTPASAVTITSLPAFLVTLIVSGSSSADPTTVTVSVPSPPSMLSFPPSETIASLPAPPLTESLPSPPLRLSLPEPPSTVSLPAPPSNVESREVALALIVSSPDSPLSSADGAQGSMRSARDRTSLPAPALTT